MRVKRSAENKKCEHKVNKDTQLGPIAEVVCLLLFRYFFCFHIGCK